MNLQQSLLTELPNLRRYARALTGTQNLGDSLVEMTLERAVTGEITIDPNNDTRVELFRAMTATWQKSMSGHKHDAEWMLPQSGVDQSLTLITPLPRQAFLLSSLEGFDDKQLGQILDRTADEVETLLQQARDEITSQTATSVLIIEDELFIATQLEQIAKDLGHAVIGIARTRDEASKFFKDMEQFLITPGIVLADIQLADGSSGIDAVNDIMQECPVPVIFITAYPERLLTGTKPEPTYLINKPFSEETVKALMTQALFTAGSNVQARVA